MDNTYYIQIIIFYVKHIIHNTFIYVVERNQQGMYLETFHILTKLQIQIGHYGHPEPS